MSVANRILRLHLFFAARRRAGFWCVGLLLSAGLVAAMFLRPVENIASMIPDDGSSLAEDFKLLQKAPFTHRVLIDVAAPPGTETVKLAAAGDALAAALPPALFPEVRGGPQIANPASFVLGVLDLLPALFTERDMAAVEKRLSPDAVRQSLRECVRTLTSPEGLGMKEVLRRDPLGLRSLALSKLSHLRLSDSIRMNHGRFMSEDGRHMLVIARPAFAMTDATGAGQVIEAFHQARASLPPGYTATLTGGLRHTLANTAAIKSDMATVLAASLAGLTLLFLACLRSRAGLFAFLVPLVILPTAAVATWFAFGSISGITLGFGSVLMGVAADYSIYVFFAMRAFPDSPQKALSRVAAPVWYGAVTSMVSFGALLFSALPGIRELAFFSLTGLFLALFLALVVLPCCIRTANDADDKARRLPSKPFFTPRQVLVLTFIVLAASVYWGEKVHFNSDLRALSAAGADLKRDEAMMHSIWGDFRDRAMVFAKGASLDDALEANRRLFATVSEKKHFPGLISLAPVLPPKRVQSDNSLRWHATFTPERRAGLRAVVAAEAARLGFTPEAFEPFWEFLAAPATVFSTPERLRAVGLGEAVDLLLARDDKDYLAISLMSDTPDAGIQKNFPDQVRTVSQTRFASELTKLVKADFLRFILLALGGNMILLYVFLRSVPLTLLSFLPTAVGLALLWGTMGTMGVDLNLFGVIALPLIIGIGVDYGIFMAIAEAGSRNGTTIRAVIVAGLSTIVGFGALTLAGHPALHSIGLTVLIGISGAVLASCLLVPPLRKRP
jgi:predicted exporter